MEKVLRVNQLDACELDDALLEVLQGQLVAAFKPLHASRLLKYLPEFKALLRLLVWKYSLSKSQFTFGQEMLGLKYNVLTRLQSTGLFVAFVLAEWIVERADTMTSYCASPSTAQKYVSRLLGALKLISLLNFVNFLLRGTYPTLKELVLGLSMGPSRPQHLREVSNVYLTREILWHGFSEFIFFILPHFNIFSIRNLFRKTIGIHSRTNANSLCGFCDAVPTLPHLSNCGHTYCYYCLRSNLLADSNFPCTVCNAQVTACIPISVVM